jgi:translation initiation factor IF-3
VRVNCHFRAREITHPELGRKKLDSMAEQLADLAIVERTPTLDGKQMIMVLAPKAKSGAKSHGKAENKQDGIQAVQDNGQGQDHAAEGVR